MDINKKLFTENCKVIHFKVIITAFNDVLCKRGMLVVVQQGLDFKQY